jgi:hypothetical protein
VVHFDEEHLPGYIWVSEPEAVEAGAEQHDLPYASGYRGLQPFLRESVPQSEIGANAAKCREGATFKARAKLIDALHADQLKSEAVRVDLGSIEYMEVSCSHGGRRDRGRARLASSHIDALHRLTLIRK